MIVLQLYTDALQVILSLQLGLGGLSAYASHNRWEIFQRIIQRSFLYLQILSQPCPRLVPDNVWSSCLGFALYCTGFHTAGHGRCHNLFRKKHLKDQSWYKPRCTPTRRTRWPVSSPSSSMSPVKMSGLDSERCSRRSIDVFHQNVKIFPRVSPLCPTLGYGPHFSSFSSSSPAWPLYWDVSGAEK